MIVNFLNLTNGLEELKHLPLENVGGFLRLESTACEQKRWFFILQGLDHTLLMNLALGNQCRIYDYSNRKQVPRALHQGVEWIRFALNWFWFGKTVKATVRGHDSTGYFRTIIAADWRSPDCDAWRDHALKKILYYKKSGFVLTNEIQIVAMGYPTTHDGDKEYYRSLLEEAYYGKQGSKEASHSTASSINQR